MSLVIIAVAVVTIFAALFVWLLRSLLAPSAVVAFDANWIDDFSIDKYRPMFRLLAEDDYEFLASQSGQPSNAVRRLRADRRRIFRAYLKSLVSDFYRLQVGLKLVMVHSEHDRPELAAQLLKQRMFFSYALVRVEFRLALHTFGLATVDVRDLIGSVDSLRMQVGNLSAHHSAA